MSTPKIPGLYRTPQVRYVYIRVSPFKSLMHLRGLLRTVYLGVPIWGCSFHQHRVAPTPSSSSQHHLRNITSESKHLILEVPKWVPPNTGYVQEWLSTVCVYRATPLETTSVFKGVAQDRVFRGAHLEVLISPTSCCTISITSATSPPTSPPPKWSPPK